MKKYIPFLVIALVAVFGVSNLVSGYSGEAPHVVVEGDYIEAQSNENLGAFPGPEIYQDVVFNGTVTTNSTLTMAGATSLSSTLSVAGATSLDTVLYEEKTDRTIATGTTLTLAESGTVYYLANAGGEAITLPAVATATGTTYTFVVASAFATDNWTITSAEGDNVEGTLIVAGAVVDCDASDVITFVADGENLGDYVTLTSDGQKWFVRESGALTASKLTCSG